MQQTDVKASGALVATGPFLDAAGKALGRCRIKAIFATGGAGAGSVVITDGLGGAPLFPLNVPINGTPYLLLPGEGILSEKGPYGTVAAIGSATIIYG